MKFIVFALLFAAFSAITYAAKAPNNSSSAQNSSSQSDNSDFHLSIDTTVEGVGSIMQSFFSSLYEMWYSKCIFNQSYL